MTAVLMQTQDLRPSGLAQYYQAVKTMELPPDNSAEENYEYDSSEVQDYSALSSFTNVNCADDKWEDGEPYTLEEGTVLFPLVKMTKPQAGTLPS